MRGEVNLKTSNCVSKLSPIKGHHGPKKRNPWEFVKGILAGESRWAAPIRGNMESHVHWHNVPQANEAVNLFKKED
jgi:hypothetical protein